MPSVNGASLRDDFDAIKAGFAWFRERGKIPKEVDELIVALCRMVALLIAVLLEKTTKKTGKNSSIPPSQTGKDEIQKSPRKKNNKGAAGNGITGSNFKKVTVEETSTVETCDSCGTDLSDIEPSAHEQRVKLDPISPK